MTDVETVRDVVDRAEDILLPETWADAIAALDRIEEELKQSAYYRECRDRWRESAEALARRL